MEPINSNLTLQRLSGWVIEQVQIAVGLASTVRLRLDTDNHELWLRSGNCIKVLPSGEQSNGRAIPTIEITYDYVTEKAMVWVDDVSSLVRPERLLDFDIRDLNDIALGEIEVSVALEKGIERIEIWNSLPANPREAIYNRAPNITGMI